MGKDNTKVFSNVIRIDHEQIQDHRRHIVDGGVEKILNVLLDTEKLLLNLGDVA